MRAYIQRLRVLLFLHPLVSILVLLFLICAVSLVVSRPVLAALGGLVAIVAGIVVWYGRHDGTRTAELNRRWGMEDDRDRDFDALEERYLTLGPDAADSDPLDASSWVDLDMDSVFSCLDRTLTSAGELMLYTMLHRVRNAPKSLTVRNRAVCCFLNEESVRLRALGMLDRLGRDSHVNLAELLWTDDTPDLGHVRLYNTLALAAVVSVLAAVFVSPIALVYCVLPVFALNALLSTVIVRDQVLASLRALRYLGKLLDAADGLASLAHPDLAFWTEGMGRRRRVVAGISRRIRLLNPEGTFAGDVFQQLTYLFSTFLLVEVRAFNRVMGEIRRQRSDLQYLVRSVGELDAFQSIASFRGSLPYCCEPEFTTGTPFLAIRDGWHPLLAEPVPNSLHCEGDSVFVTGSNMAGKSTFLRMVAVNVILAQTVHLCCARAYAATPFRLASSITHVDDITESTSYFLAEGRRLLHLLQSAEEERTPYLCIIDEILRGTNSAERHAASLAVLRHLAATGAVVVVASHDTDLGRMLEDRYRLFHFSESFEQDELVFDYQLKPGICGLGNAIRTLGWMGFPDSVVDQAREYLARTQQGAAPRDDVGEQGD